MTSNSRFWYFTRKQGYKKRETEESRKIYVGNLNNQATRKTLKDYFRQWGVVMNCQIKKQKGHQGGQFGFVTFRDSHMVDKTQAARPHKIEGTKVFTRRFIPQKNGGKPDAIMKVNKLLVGPLKANVWMDDLREYFSVFGNIVNIQSQKEEMGKKGRFSIIEFDDYDPVDKVQFGTHFIKGHEVEVKKALSKEERKIIERKINCQRRFRKNNGCQK